MVTCTKCGKEFDWRGPERVAGMAAEVMGDEYIETWFFCADCGVYTEEIYHDRFLGEDSAHVSGPIEKQRGDELVELIRQCATPMNKKCDCAAHKAYFRSPDAS
jgi:hypothetical protein